VSGDALRVALVTDVFQGPDGPERLLARLEEARALGAELAVLPELPLNDWCPARRTRSPGDAEPPGGERQQAQARAARATGVALLGGAIVEEGGAGRRHNTALLFDHRGQLVSRYRKVHLPHEEGFWEMDHYDAGDALARPVGLAGFDVGVQICSDVNRPEGCHLLGAMGALAVLSPRATPAETYERWRFVLRANAATSTTYLLSVNRPEEPGSPVGGASLAIGPCGEVLAETTDPVAVVALSRPVVEAARGKYPGYLELRAELYAEGWAEVARSRLRLRTSGVPVGSGGTGSAEGRFAPAAPPLRERSFD
jgi:N-carbamoylputrescine amidase